MENATKHKNKLTQNKEIQKKTYFRSTLEQVSLIHWDPAKILGINDLEMKTQEIL